MKLKVEGTVAGAAVEAKVEVESESQVHKRCQTKAKYILSGQALHSGCSEGTDMSDCTYVTSINFLLKRMLEHGLKANLSPSLNA